jgi:hypothetical protein
MNTYPKPCLGQCNVRFDERPMVFRKADERREDGSRLQGSGRLRTPSRPCTQVTELHRRPFQSSAVDGGGGGPENMNVLFGPNASYTNFKDPGLLDLDP